MTLKMRIPLVRLISSEVYRCQGPDTAFFNFNYLISRGVPRDISEILAGCKYTLENSVEATRKEYLRLIKSTRYSKKDLAELIASQGYIYLGGPTEREEIFGSRATQTMKKMSLEEVSVEESEEEVLKEAK